MQITVLSSVLIVLFGERYRTLRFRTAFLLYFFIVVLGAIPNVRSEIGEFASGLVLHATAYAAITFLLSTGSGASRRRALFQAFIIALAMGALDEYIQSYFPYRRASLQDWLVDGTASLITVALLSRFSPTARLQALEKRT
ncbi:MAG: VanZ family protein [Pseudomonadota bacterium]